MISKGVKRLAEALRWQDPTYEWEQIHDLVHSPLYAYDSTGAITGASALGKIAIKLLGIEDVWERMHEDDDEDALINEVLQVAGLPQKVGGFHHPLSQESGDLLDIIEALNHEERWSFDAIAIWLEQEADRIALLEQGLVQPPLW